MNISPRISAPEFSQHTTPRDSITPHFSSSSSATTGDQTRHAPISNPFQNSSPLFTSATGSRVNPYSSAALTPSEVRDDSPGGVDDTPPADDYEVKDVLNIAEHSQTELLVMLSSLLMKITCSNDSLHSGVNAISPPNPGSPLLAFHARNIPSISIQSYLTRILKYCPMSSDIFLSLLVYFDRMSRAPETVVTTDLDTFTSTKQLINDERHPFSIDSYNVHRLVITGIVVASKFCSDVFYTNSRYAKVGGLPLSELNHLEFQFLLLNDFRLMIPMEELQKYGNQLLAFWKHEKASIP
ncbi:putative Cyclin-dependent protein kinase complex component [Taphrina deformans PYCC 5710]|uniref:Cyclin-dependent protein kinase complex component n=1 Tax=Taphrina deformans (strain PYCC 5710 / ATCC 11124 / CBS 356.35 / IMI 108563 / JCM 9778 / NBRC 8474) TaxID=1097556 RepID=R4X6L2_TAPDE|nr:putative Cyclin-dependent protein kinase complex component [Taphrina deformans PYCC 5710]|eukprot:CCG80811.1 putative Cyclin-dependent protein kinase complex component [Taphrina deformans PYCC 5710]